MTSDSITGASSINLEKDVTQIKAIKSGWLCIDRQTVQSGALRLEQNAGMQTVMSDMVDHQSV
jgi:hypothetical protein